MGGVGNDDLGPGRILPVGVICLDEQQAGELAVSARRRLEGHAVHAGDLTQQLLRLCIGLQAALDRLHRLERMDLGKAGQRRHVLVDLGVVLHGAGAQGIEPVVDAVDPLGQGGIVAGQLRLRHMGQVQGRGAGLGQGHLRHIAGGHQAQVLTGSAFFKY